MISYKKILNMKIVMNYEILLIRIMKCPINLKNSFWKLEL